MEKRGPRTEAGKAAVRLNALQHGIWSASPVVPSLEREEDWQGHLDGILASLAPSDYLESCLAERIAGLIWRLRRVTAFETETMMTAVGDVNDGWAREEAAVKELARRELAHKEPAKTSSYAWDAKKPPSKAEWMARRRADLIIPPGPTLDRVTRYEAHLHRQLLQTMHELEALQGRRRGEATPLARLDVQGGPEN